MMVKQPDKEKCEARFSFFLSQPPNPGLVYRGCTRPLVVGGARGSNFVALSKMVHVLSCFV